MNILGIMHGKIVLLLLSFLFLTGCGSKVSILKSEAMEETSHRESTSQIETTDSEDTEEQKDASLEEPDDSEQEGAEPLIYVDLCGAVACPGVYALVQGSRVFQLIEMAGGFTEDAYTRQINQADILEDGEQIYVYTLQEAEELLSQGTSLDLGLKETAQTSDTKVNLNQADKNALMTLQGIGETRAEAIIKYREEHGKFNRIEELMQVDGIKEKTYDKIKDCITVQ